MRAVKKLNMSEFQKCGEIMVAVKKNRFAMACNFCRRSFSPLAAFMRHLQLQHNDVLEFVQPTKEVEVYAVEELMNQTNASCMPETESEESNMNEEVDKWLSPQDKKKLKDGVEPNNLPTTENITKPKEADDAEESSEENLANMSILNALKDCDVSFNLMDNLDNTIVEEEEEEPKKTNHESEDNLDNTLLREIQNNWEDSDTNESLLKSIDCTATDLADSTKHMLNLSTEMEDADVTMSEMLITSTRLEDKLETRGIKNLLEGLEDLDDVDSLLENLENNISNEEDLKENPISKIESKKAFKKNEKPKVLLNENIQTKTLNTKETSNETVGKSKFFTQLKKIDIEVNKMSDFEKRLKQLEEDLEDEEPPAKDILNKNETCNKKAIKSNENVKKSTNDFASKLKDLEDLLNEDDIPSENFKEVKQSHDRSQKTSGYSKVLNKTSEKENDFALKLKNLEDSLNIEDFSEESKTQSNSSKPLNEDLTKALAKALGDEDLDMLSMEAKDEMEDEEMPLNQSLLNLLDKELMDEVITEKDEVSKGESRPVSQNPTVINGTRDHQIKKLPQIVKSSKTIRKSLIETKSNIKSKYQRTNLKARTKLIGTNQVSHSSVLKEGNSLKSSQITENKIPFKGNHEAFMQQQKLNQAQNISKSPAKAFTTLNDIKGSRLRKTPNKENQENTTPVLNVRNIKREKVTPINFVNTDRGDKTPLKMEQMFLKQSPKTQEKLETLISDTTPKKGNKTPQEVKIKQSPKTQGKRENSNPSQTPNVIRQKTPTTRNASGMKQSPKTQEKKDKYISNNTTLRRRESLKSPLDKEAESNRNSSGMKQSPKAQEKMEKYISNNTTPRRREDSKSPSVKGTESKSPLNTSSKSNEKKSPNSRNSSSQQTTKSSPVNDKSPIHKDFRTPLTTPQRLRNVAIKLQRFSPDKNTTQKPNTLTNSRSDSNSLSREDEAKQISKQFNLPKGISLTVAPRPNILPEVNQFDLNETLIKPLTSSKQNLSESKLELGVKEENSSITTIQSTLIQPSNITVETFKKEPISSKIRQRKASIDIIPANGQSSANKTPRHSNLDYKSYAVHRSARKSEVLQRMRHIKKQIFKSIDSGELISKINQKSPLVKKRKSKVLIENVQILPNIDNMKMTPLINPFDNFKKPFANNVPPTNVRIASPKNLNDDQKQAKKSLEIFDTQETPINDDEKMIKRSLKRPATSPLMDEEKSVKRLQISEPIGEKSSELENTQLGLSESVVDFLQRDLKANRLNVESFLQEDLAKDDSRPDETSLESNANDTKMEEKAKAKDNDNSNSNLIDDLLEQVDNEQFKKPKETPKEMDETFKNDQTVKDFDESKDINLLAKIGLKVIKLPEIENDISLAELDAMHEKASKFAGIYRNFSRIWSTKNGETLTLKEELEKSFKQLLIETNLAFKLDWTLVEIKRITNMISLWYTNNFNNKLIEKRKISECTNRYLLMFHYIPKTTRRFFYCEYCDEYSSTEHKYYTHRIVHTGALYPYDCQKCSQGFKALRTLRTHELTCNGSKPLNLNYVSATYEKSVIRINKCQACKEIFSSSELLYEHSKKHLKTVYNCAKCELVFASAIDVQNHMTICNSNAKRIPKQCTPRPAKGRPNN